MEHVEEGDVADGDMKMEDLEEGQESYHVDDIIPGVEEEVEMDEEVLQCMLRDFEEERNMKELYVSEIRWVFTRKSQR
jgi:hypothetical protein